MADIDLEMDSPLVSSDFDTIADEIAETEIRLVLLGKTGSGKSRTGCTILGNDEAFKYSSVRESCTLTCQHKEKSRFGKNIRIIDTPGLFDTSRSEEDIQEEIIKCVANSAPGVHAFLVVISAGARMTPEERKALDRIQKMFGDNIFKYMIIVVTNKEKIDAALEDKEEGAKPFPEWLEDPQDTLKELYDNCGKRAVAFENRERDREKKEDQVKALLGKVEEMLKGNNRKYYTDENMLEAERKLRLETEKEMKSIFSMLEESRREAMERQKAMEKQIEQVTNALGKSLEEKEAEMQKLKTELKKTKDEIAQKDSERQEAVANARESARQKVEQAEKSRVCPIL